MDLLWVKFKYVHLNETHVLCIIIQVDALAQVKHLINFGWTERQWVDSSNRESKVILEKVYKKSTRKINNNYIFYNYWMIIENYKKDYDVHTNLY